MHCILCVLKYVPCADYNKTNNNTDTNQHTYTDTRQMHVVYFSPVFSPPSGPVADQHVCSHTMEEQAMLPGTLMHTHEEHTFTHTHTHTRTRCTQSHK